MDLQVKEGLRVTSPVLVGLQVNKEEAAYTHHSNQKPFSFINTDKRSKRWERKKKFPGIRPPLPSSHYKYAIILLALVSASDI